MNDVVSGGIAAVALMATIGGSPTVRVGVEFAILGLDLPPDFRSQMNLLDFSVGYLAVARRSIHSDRVSCAFGAAACDYHG